MLALLLLSRELYAIYFIRAIYNFIIVMGHLCDTLYTSTYFYLFPPTQQEETDHETTI